MHPSPWNYPLSSCFYKTSSSSFPFYFYFLSFSFFFLFRDDRDPEGNDFPTFLPEISDDLVQDTKQKRLEDAQGTNK